MTDLQKEAYEEAQRRYPEAASGLYWFISAAGMNFEKPNNEQLKWAQDVIDQQRYG